MPADPFIACRGLTRTYRRGDVEITPLDALDLDVGRGEFVALMGPSGSGKTTLLNLVGGIDRPTAGSLTVGGVAIEGGRHPVLDRTLASSFVPNDTALGGNASSPTLALITGPNMAGKSTYIRQVALIALLAHVGSFVPAAKAEIGVLDAILTRIGSADEIHSGQSTFMVEMTETANILHHATERSLVILDEIGRGTSTLDGLSLAWAITETLAARGASTLFATHYHELTQLADTLPAVTNLHVSVREWNDEVVFLHRIVPGRTDRSYGIHVARLAGLPRETIARAKEVLELLGKVEVADALGGRAKEIAVTTKRSAQAAPQLSLFTEYVEHPAVGELRKVDMNTLTPLAAFDLLRRLSESTRA